MLLLHTFIDEFFNNAEAVTELSFVDVFIILSSKRFVFFPFGATKLNRSENVLCVQFSLRQNIFLVFNKRIACLSWIGISWISRWYMEWIFDEVSPQKGHLTSFSIDSAININFYFLILYPTHFKLLSKFCINSCFIISPSSNNYKAKSLYYQLSLERTVGAFTHYIW